ncbi:endonuclease SmrB [Motilimonas eburnea]|uniref:endonuclease SmrB n=1 Tax=Motilimonas eburnea TaxID=1737488 RepID=UPI001E3D0312|nr:endonuclease SmrB [Motilimonas eburnea]
MSNKEVSQNQSIDPMLDEGDDFALFKQAISGTRKIKQDTIKPDKPRIKEKIQRNEIKQEALEKDYFSDLYEPHLDEQGPTRYIRQDADKFELKKLRRGDYAPEIFLDLHGLTQQQAKQELAALIHECKKRHYQTCCVMHGIGAHILKRKTPLWLAQHPDVVAFHQAPLEYGGNGALLVLIEIEAQYLRR